MILLDAGPMIAIIDRSDAHHHACLEVLRQHANQSLLTTWPCFTEAIYLLGRKGGYSMQRALWELWRDRSLEIHTQTLEEVLDAEALMERYQDLPMDLADATLVAAANALGLTRVFTLDSDFHVYKLKNGTTLEVVP